MNFSLEKRLSEGNLRTLRITPAHLIDFTSNDYLGFARSEELRTCIASQEVSDKFRINGSTGSRLLSGNSSLAEELELFIAKFHKAESGLLFNSGYDANVGLFSCIAQRSDTILYDELSHASVIDGIRLSYAHTFKFRHNDLEHLEELLKKTKDIKYVAVESVYSMDGDFSPLQTLAELCQRYHANLIVDEAHATGVFSERGEGRVVELGLEKNIFARMHTFGKALGCHGAIVLGSESLKSHLINFSRPFIYSTALPCHSLSSIKCAYTFLESHIEKMNELKERIRFFRESVKNVREVHFSDRSGPIQNVIIPGNERVKKLATELQEMGYGLRPILSPTVTTGSERLRICLHSFNTQEEMKGLVSAIETLADKKNHK